MKHALSLLLFVLVVIALLSGCASVTDKPVSPRAGRADTLQTKESDHFEYHSDTEVPEGPGILTGENGEFRVL
jgi:outer membrane biogenesis lipoprotein LolB